MLLSVAIPTRNRVDVLAGLLDSLAAQVPVPFQWEVLVVDNASTDGTADMVAAKAGQLPITIRHVVEERLGLHYGRHRGARDGRGKVVAYLDDDMTVAPTWITAAQRIERGEAQAVVGRILPHWLGEPADWLVKLSSDGLFPYLGILDLGTRLQEVEAEMVFGGNCFLPRELVFELGGFHPDGVPADRLCYRGDGETALMGRFRERGLKALYDPAAQVFHIIPAERMTVEYLCKRAYTQGISNSFTAFRYERLGEGRPPAGHDLSRYLPHRVFGGVVRRLVRKLGEMAGDPIPGIERQLAHHRELGWKFHREALANDPDLVAWALRADFLD